MADMTREEAIRLTQRVREKHVDRYCGKIYSDALDFAISDMKRVEVLDAEVERLIGGIAMVREKIIDLNPKPTAEDVVDGNPVKEAIWENITDVLNIINKHLGEVKV